MGKKFKRDISSLNAVFEHIAGFIDKHSLNESAAFSMSVAVEELFTNMVKYDADNPNPIGLTLSKTHDAIVAELTDFTVEPFDITKAGTYNDTLPLEKRPIGGIGIHLVNKMVDKISYEYKNRQCKITLTKYLGVSNVRDRNR